MSQSISADYQLDVKGESCPYPAISTLNAMKQLQKGEILEVISDCAQSINNIPLDMKNHGYTMLEIVQSGTDLHFFIQR